MQLLFIFTKVWLRRQFGTMQMWSTWKIYKSKELPYGRRRDQSPLTFAPRPRRPRRSRRLARSLPRRPSRPLCPPPCHAGRPFSPRPRLHKRTRRRKRGSKWVELVPSIWRNQSNRSTYLNSQLNADLTRFNSSWANLRGRRWWSRNILLRERRW
jgi:hypothetical protein